MKHPFTLYPYSLLWRMARPILRRHKRLHADFSLRLVPDVWGELPWGRHPTDLWIQAASGGESFLAKQLLGELDALCAIRQQQTLRILCTSCTRQGLDVLESAIKLAGAVWPHIELAVQVFPLDEPGVMRRALEFVSPRALVFLETEIWPGLMAACAEKSIPTIVVNGRMTNKSYSGYRLLGSFLRSVAPRRILAMDETDASRFAGLFGSDRVGIMPNMKFDGIPLAVQDQDENAPAYKLLPQPLPVILLASVREEEEQLLTPVIRCLREQESGAVIVVAPRHMERVSAWHGRLSEIYGHGCVLRSMLEQEGRKATAGQILVWDRFGELPALYGRASAVFVGGSLAPLGGQNFLEAAGQGKVPVIGPHWKNFSWIGEEFFSSKIGVRVANARDLVSALIENLRSPLPPEDVRKRLCEYIAPRRGGSRIAAKAVWDVAVNGGTG